MIVRPAIAACVVALASCAPPAMHATPQPPTPPRSPIDHAPGGAILDVPADVRATYRRVEVRRLPGGNVEIVTQRDGPSGRSFVARECGCAAGTYRVIGEGSTIDELRRAARPSERMSRLVAGSISQQVCDAAC